MARILAIDYGQKRTGIAVTDDLQIIATPLTTVDTPKLMAFLTDYCGKENVECIVVGEPKHLNNTPSESAKFIEPFLKQLRKAFPDKEIARVDERFTSKIASQAIVNSGLHKKQRQNKALVDTVSATLILQSYMDRKNNTK
ncbi:MAG: Holliday junction resolvase RuvX [Bacteroidales bacterium]|jgi:putative Holliday junction resolvase|nr:Holliday junction resolvase RuvX [Bacteroidales bacterium]MBR5028727.1 Holliday junction resolvase RuvX [Bacteroidales bacterium]